MRWLDVIGIVLCVAGVAISAEPATVSVSIEVVEQSSASDAPVDGASVMLRDAGGTEYDDYADESGSVSLEVPEGEYTLVVSASGFETNSSDISVGEGNSEFRVRLEYAE
jgi:hypothetical protein